MINIKRLNIIPKALLTFIFLIALTPIASGFNPVRTRTKATDKSSTVESGIQLSSKPNLGFYLTPLFGYESNYAFTPLSPQGSSIFAFEGGMDLRFQPSKELRVYSEFSGMVRMPLADSRFTEYLLEAPALIFIHLDPQLELFLSNYAAMERSRTPPVGMPGLVPLGSTYWSIEDTLRPALTYYINREFFVEAGPYIRVKQVDLKDNRDESDFRMFDLGLNLSAKLLYKDLLSARLKYDLAYRMFPGEINATPFSAGGEPLNDHNLTMTRHILGAYFTAKPIPMLELFASYALRYVDDSDGYYTSSENLLGGGISLSLSEILTLSLNIHYQSRNYSERSEHPFDSEDNAFDLQKWQVLKENVLFVNARLGVAITDWIEAVALYEFEDATAENSIPAEEDLLTYHRFLAGVSLFF